jgi:hypothetical protein
MCVNVIQSAVISRYINRYILGNLHGGDIQVCVMCVISGLGNYGSLELPFVVLNANKYVLQNVNILKI